MRIVDFVTIRPCLYVPFRTPRGIDGRDTVEAVQKNMVYKNTRPSRVRVSGTDRFPYKDILQDSKNFVWGFL
jgi:hypothetical protein